MKPRDIISATIIVIVFAIASSSAYADEFKFYIVEDDVRGSEATPRRSEKDDLFVSYNGMDLLISNDNFQKLYSKSIFAEIDLDQDGFKEVILEMHNGGNCCGSEYAVVSYRGENFFSIAEHDALSGAGFPTLKIISGSNKPLLKVVNLSEGAENSSMQTDMYVLEFVLGELKAVSKTSNAALIPAILEVNSNEFDANDPSDIVREFDADGDNVPDQLICKYWQRWGSTVCEVESSKYGLINSHTGCKRVGVLATNTNGIRDLVCNQFSILSYDGERFSEKY